MERPPMELTDEQRECLDLDRDMVVVAGAGSGKTRVLVERYLHILRTRDAGIESILAVTFTHKAAAEMIDRVRHALGAEIAADPTSERWRRLREDMARARIDTIHAFCESLLREFPMEAGIDPGFACIDAREMQELLADAVDTALTRAARGGDSAGTDALGRLLSHRSRDTLRRQLLGLLADSRRGKPFLKYARDAGADKLYHEMEQRNVAHQEDVVRALLTPELIATLHNVIELRPDDESDKAWTRVRKVIPEIEALRVEMPLAEALGALQRLRKAFSTKADTPLKQWRTATANWPCKEIAREFKDRCKHAAALLYANQKPFLGALGELDRRAAPIICDLAVLFFEAQRVLRESMGNGRKLGFDDLEDRARDLLTSAPAHKQIVRAVRRRFGHILVDEFQDTSTIQWEILSAIRGNPPHADAPRFFLVGDPKQSIYGFRGAEVGIMRAARDDATLAQGSLSRNFRSLGAVMDFQNLFFPKLMASAERGFEAPYDAMEGERKGGDHPRGRVEILVARAPLDENPGADRDLVAIEAEMIAAKIANILAHAGEHRVYRKRDFEGREVNDYTPAEPGDIALLLRRRLHLAAYESALRAQRLPYTVHKGIGFFARQEVMDLCNLLRFLVNEGDSISLAGLLRSPLFGMSDEGLFRLCRSFRDRGGALWKFLREGAPELSPSDEDARRRAETMLSRWRVMCGRVDVTELLRTVIDDTGLAGSLARGPQGEQRVANLDKLLDLVRTVQDRGAMPLPAIVQHLDDLVEDETREGLAQLELDNSNAVKLLTVHAAKGLEFPIVFVPDMARRFRNANDGTNADSDLGVGITVPVIEERKSRPTVLHKRIQQRRKARDLAEEKRLFYVAVTRARDELYLVGHPRKKAGGAINSWWGWLRQHAGLDEISADGAARLVHDERSLDLPVIASLEAIGAPAPDDDGPPPLYDLLDDVLDDVLDDAPGDDAAETVARIHEEMEFREESRRLSSFSATDLVEYRRCPARFYLLRAAGIPESMLRPSSSGAGGGAAGGAAGGGSHGRSVGTLAHGILERLDDLDAIERAELRQRVKALARGGKEIDDISEDAIDEATRIVMNFRGTDLYRELRSAEGRHTELPFILRLDGVIINGAIDLVYRANGRWRVIDYKTTHIAARNRNKQLEEMREHYRPQVEVYALATARMFKTDCVDAALYLTDIGEEIAFSYTTDDLERVEQEMTEEVRRMAAGSPAEFPPGKHADCESCAYRRSRLCDGAKGPRVDARRRSVPPVVDPPR